MAKLALLAGWYYPDSVGGTEEYVRALARDLRALGHEICVSAPALDEREHEYEHEGIPVYRYPVSERPSRAEVRGIEEPRYLDVFTGWLKRYAPDIVHGHSFTRGCGAAHYRSVSESDVPYVLSVHTPHLVCGRGTLMRWGSTPCDGHFRPVRCATCCMQQSGLPRAAGWPLAMAALEHAPRGLPNDVQTAITFRRQLERDRDTSRAALAGAARVVAVSQWLCDLLEGMGVSRNKLRLSRQGVADDAPAIVQRPQQRDAKFRIAYIGRFDRVKGVDLLVRAMLRVPRSEAMELHLFGVTQGREGAEYLRKIERLARGDARIVFRGALATTDRHRVLSEMEMLAVPSMWFETGPLVVLEAFAAGLPVLGSAIGGIAERVKHGESGWLVPPGDINAWTKALSDLYRRWKEGDWRWKLPRARTSADVAREMDEMYQEVLDARRPRQISEVIS